eukprot:6321901-Prorocentrum_lima.AAC.1
MRRLQDHGPQLYMLEDWRPSQEPTNPTRDAFYDTTVVAPLTEETAAQYYKNTGWGLGRAETT